MTKKPLLKGISFLALLYSIFIISACSCDHCQTSDLEAHTWELVKYTNSDNCLVSAIPPNVPLPASSGITLNINAGNAGGSDGCNTYGGDFSNDATDCSFSITNILTTLIACNPPVSTKAARYMSILAEARYYSIRSGRLILSTPDDRVLIFEEQKSQDGPVIKGT